MRNAWIRTEGSPERPGQVKFLNAQLDTWYTFSRVRLASDFFVLLENCSYCVGRGVASVLEWPVEE